MTYKEIVGNLFASEAMALVNTVNCVGAMGKGIALEFRRRYPQMFKQYQTDCENKKLVPGRIYTYPQEERLILNFAIKNDWKHPSKLQWIESCLRQFRNHYQQRCITSVAFPWMGAESGGIPLEIVKSTMRAHLQPLKDLEIEVYSFDPQAYDPLFECLRKFAESGKIENYQKLSGIKEKTLIQILESVRNQEVQGLSQIAHLKGIGKNTIDRLYVFLTEQLKDAKNIEINNNPPQINQLNLFEL